MDITPQESREIASAPLQALAQGSMFWRPAYVASSPWLHHLPWLFWLVEALRPQRCVTLGAAQGSPHLAFCQGVARLDLQSDCLLVDPASEEVAEDIHGWAERLYGAMSSWLQISPHRAAKQVENGSVDILALDVQEDDYGELEELIDRWLPKLSSQAVVLFPAINKRAGSRALPRLFSELEQEYPSFTFRHGDGLGILVVGESIPALVQMLLERFDTPESATIVRDVFSRLGRGCADQAVIIDQKSRLKFLRQQLDEQEQSRQNVEEIKMLQRISEQRFNDARDQLESLKLENQRLVSDSSAGLTQLSAATQQLHEVQSALQARDNQVNELQRAIALKDQELDAHLQELAEFSELAEQRYENEHSLTAEAEESSSLLMEELEMSKGRWELDRKSLEDKILLREHEASELKQEVEHLKLLISTKDQLITELRSLGESRDKYTDSQLAEHSSLAEQIAKAHASNDSLSRQLRAADKEKAARDQLNSSLKEQLEVLRRENERLNKVEQENASLNRQLKQAKQLDLESKELKAENKRLKADISDRDTLISNQFEELASLMERQAGHNSESQSASVEPESDKESASQHLAANVDISHRSSDAIDSRNQASETTAQPIEDLDHKSFFGGLGQGLDRRKKRKLERQAQEKAYEEITSSNWFDAEWYLDRYPDVAKDERFSKHPAMHYLKFGGFEARNPSEYFDSEAYLATYPDVAESGINPLLHFIRQGLKEGRSPQPDVD